MKMLLIIASFLSLNVHAQSSQSNASLGSGIERFDLEFVASTEQLRARSGELETIGFYNKFDTALTYALGRNDDLRVYGSAIVETYTEEENKSYLDLAELMYRRKNILTQAAHGVDMSIELKTYYLLDYDKREMYGYNGAFIPQLVLKKNFTRRFSTKFKARTHHYFRTSGSLATKRQETRFYLTPSYYIGKGFITGAEFKYKNKRYGAITSTRRGRSVTTTPRKKDELTVRPSLMYVFNKDLMAEGYIESKLMKSHDDRTIEENYLKASVFGASLYYTAF